MEFQPGFREGFQYDLGWWNSTEFPRYPLHQYHQGNWLGYLSTSYEKNFDGSQQIKTVDMSLTFVIACLYLFDVYFGIKIMAAFIPYKIKWIQAGWNLALAIFSGVCVFHMTAQILYELHTGASLYYLTCDKNTGLFNGTSGFWGYAFLMSKILEFGDTILLVLQKKPVIFLHWYHHVTVYLYCAYAYQSGSTYSVWFSTMNAYVHLFMYFYYFLTSLGYRPRWAIWITRIQIAQMFVGTFLCLSNWYFIINKIPCNGNSRELVWGTLMYLSYLILFLQFSLKRYSK